VQDRNGAANGAAVFNGADAYISVQARLPPTRSPTGR
jgi:hypothetical protein